MNSYQHLDKFVTYILLVDTIHSKKRKRLEVLSTWINVKIRSIHDIFLSSALVFFFCLLLIFYSLLNGTPFILSLCKSFSSILIFFFFFAQMFSTLILVEILFHLANSLWNWNSNKKSKKKKERTKYQVQRTHTHTHNNLKYNKIPH